MPPLYLIVSSMPPASKVTMISSPMPMMPFPMDANQPKKSKLPVYKPTAPVEMMPSSSTNMTLIPLMAVPKTMR